MVHGLERAGWALAKGETFCPECAAARNLPVLPAAAREEGSASASAPVEIPPRSSPSCQVR